MAAFAFTIFLGAFLLFQIQPLIAKFILPWFGGGPGVWTACMLFFQVVLLGGYAYAHLLSRWVKPRTQVMGHLLLLAVAIVFLPTIPSDAWKPNAETQPLPRILELLAATLGLPYFLLAATGPLMQDWFRRTHPGRSPYRLYALSNAGSLLALVSYPFFFEAHFARQTQAELWAAGLAVYAVACAGCGFRLWRGSDAAYGARLENPGAGAGPGVSAATCLMWVLLPACASVLLLATTNKLCQDVAVIPFLWVLPLALYLLSFVLCFDRPQWYRRFPFTLALIAALSGYCWALFNVESASIHRQVTIYCGGLFVCCVVCHGELYRLRPSAGGLTGYYLAIAAGGALGGLFVAVAAPLLFPNYYELQLGILLCGVLFLAVCASVRGPIADSAAVQTPEGGLDAHEASGARAWCGRVWKRLLAVGCWRWLGCVLPFVAFAGLDWLVRDWRPRLSQVPTGYFVALRLILWGLLLATTGAWLVRGKHRGFRYWRQMTCFWLALGCGALGVVLWKTGLSPEDDVIYASRSFYGVLTIFEHFRDDPENRYLLLQHGRITHGLQFTRFPRDHWATSYYGEQSGIARAMNALPPGGRRIGLVGLGTGTLTALGRAGDYFRIYEINPQVRDLAWKRFSYLSNTAARVDIIMGDARLSMEREPSQQFDLLALDAFSSDSIPVHLLTREAFELYQRHLRTNGVVAIHISNHYLDLEPVTVNLAHRFHYRASLIDYDENEEDWWMYSSTWMLLSRDARIMGTPAIAEGISAVRSGEPTVPLWTDDFASLFQILRR